MTKIKRLKKLEAFEERWKDCQRCDLHEGRSKVVHWRGSPWAGLCLIGEAPGEEEDKKGFPFVGRSGKILDGLLIKAGIDLTEDVFIINTVGCRPPSNRNPKNAETKVCQKRVEELLDIVKPKAILFIGRVAALKYAGISSIGSWRQEKVSVDLFIKDKLVSIPATVTYHPSYLIRNGNKTELRKKVIKDIKFALRLIK